MPLCKAAHPSAPRRRRTHPIYTAQSVLAAILVPVPELSFCKGENKDQCCGTKIRPDTEMISSARCRQLSCATSRARELLAEEENEHLAMASRARANFYAFFPTGGGLPVHFPDWRKASRCDEDVEITIIYIVFNSG